MKTTIFVEVTLPRNYKVDLSHGKPTSPRMVIFGWYENQQEGWGGCLAPSGLHGKNGWMESAEVKDVANEATLPDDLYVIVSTNGASWYATAAFVSKEKAEIAISQNQSSSWASWSVMVPRGKNEKDPRDLYAFQF
ncbi:MAG: hypothetical protein WCV79_04495 [Candidatus Paceibacterota bacterium]